MEWYGCLFEAKPLYEESDNYWYPAYNTSIKMAMTGEPNEDSANKPVILCRAS